MGWFTYDVNHQMIITSFQHEWQERIHIFTCMVRNCIVQTFAPFCTGTCGLGREGFIRFTRYERHNLYFQKTGYGNRNILFFGKRFLWVCNYNRLLSIIKIDDTEGLESWLINDRISFDRIWMGGDWLWHIFGVKVLDHVPFTGLF